MERVNIKDDLLGGTTLECALDARKWAWEQAALIHGSNFDLEGHGDRMEKTAVRLADFIQTGTFEVA